MENLVKKTMTAFLVLLTLMIPVSAGTIGQIGVGNVTISQGDEVFTISFDYDVVNATVASAGLVVGVEDANANPNSISSQAVLVEWEETGDADKTASATFVAGDLEVGEYEILVTTDEAAGDTINGTVFTLFVREATPDYYATNLVADNDYEDEVSPGDTIVLELELDMTRVNSGISEANWLTFEDVSLEAYLVDSNSSSGLRVSDIQETSDFNLAGDEEETITMRFEVDEDLEEGRYYIYVTGTSDQGDLFAEYFPFDIERDEHSLVVTDLRVSNAEAGETVDVAVTILNNGQTDEDNVLVSLSVAGETVTSDYFTVEEDEELVRYFTLTLPSGASGNELVTVAVANEDVSVSSSTTVNVDARNQAASLTEEQVAALLEARLNQGNNNGFDDLSLGWLVAGLLVVYLLVSNRGLMPTTSRAASTSSRGRKSSKKYY